MSYDSHDSHETPLTGPDTQAAFTGLILGAVVIFALLFSIVTITNRHYAASEPAAAAAQ